MTTTIILPTKNEEGAIVQTISTIQRVCDNPILVVDGNSTDRTVVLAKSFKNVEVIHDDGSGKGAALRQAFEYCRPNNVVFVDVDGTYDVHRIPEFVAALDDGYDAVTGVISKYDKDAQSTWFGVGLWKPFDILWKISFLVLYREWNVNNLSGFRALSRHAIDVMKLKEHGFGIETEISIKIIKSGFEHLQFDTIYHKRVGETKLGALDSIHKNPSMIKDWIEIWYSLFKYAFWRP